MNRGDGKHWMTMRTSKMLHWSNSNSFNLLSSTNRYLPKRSSFNRRSMSLCTVIFAV